MGSIIFLYFIMKLSYIEYPSTFQVLTLTKPSDYFFLVMLSSFSSYYAISR